MLLPSPELFAETKPLESECLCYTDARTEIESMAFCQRPRPPHSVTFAPVHRDLCSVFYRHHLMKQADGLNLMKSIFDKFSPNASVTSSQVKEFEECQQCPT
jgi:hypothetical protein